MSLESIPVKIIGKQLIYNQISLERFLEQHNGKTADLVVRKSVRSLSQNRFYWLYLEIIANETGNTADEIHEWAKRVFLPPRFINVRGKEVKIPASTTDLSKAEFGEYMDKICAETNVPIPDPKQLPNYIPNY